MNISYHPAEEALAIGFEGAEKEFLILSLVALRQHYEVDPAELPDPLRREWEPRLSSRDDPAFAEAAADLREARLAWQSDRLRLVEKWLGPGGALADKDDVPLVLDRDEIDPFLALLNDRRLALAALHALGEDLMAIHPAAAPPEHQPSLWEIHFLAVILEACLQALDPGEE